MNGSGLQFITDTDKRGAKTPLFHFSKDTWENVSRLTNNLWTINYSRLNSNMKEAIL